MTPFLVFEEEKAESPPAQPPLPGDVFRSLPGAGEIDWEDVYNGEFETECLRFAKVDCPYCGRTCSPLLSPSQIFQCSGWRWVGLEYQEPYTEHAARCPRCHVYYRFLIYVPQ